MLACSMDSLEQRPMAWCRFPQGFKTELWSTRNPFLADLLSVS